MRKNFTYSHNMERARNIWSLQGGVICRTIGIARDGAWEVMRASQCFRSGGGGSAVDGASELKREALTEGASSREDDGDDFKEH